MAALVEQQSLGWQLLEAAPDPTVVVDRVGRIGYVNRRTEDVFGYSPEELIGQQVEVLIPSALARNHAQLIEEYMLEPQPRPMGEGLELSARHRSGREFPVEVSLSPLRSESGLLVLAAIRDITERRKYEKRLAFQALHDGLTGLPNRDLLMDRLVQALARRARHGRRPVVFYLDLDRFKWVNDSFGHHAGDDVLVAVANRIEDVVRDEDTVARFGGDEFVIMCQDMPTEDEALVLAERCGQAIAMPLTLAGTEIKVTASIGIAFAADEGAGRSAQELIRSADTAMYRAKKEGRGRIEVFRGSPPSRARDPLERELRLRKAIDDGEIVAYYQPEIELSTSRVVGLEALARWQDPQRGVVLPDEFISLAEESGLIIDLGSEICRAACEGAMPLDLDDAKRTLAVNVSPRQLLTPGLPEALGGILTMTGVAPASLVVEITENVLLRDISASSAALRSLKDIGVRVALDDFGTGYSSMLYLKGLPLDELKIDRTFVAGLGRDYRDQVIVSTVIDLAHGLGITTTAEGVENEEQLSLLRSFGCERAQGFYWTPALPAEETARWINARQPGCDPVP